MKYVKWLWHNTLGIRYNTAVRIVVGIIQTALGLTMVWLSRHFIDETIRTGTTDQILQMIALLVFTVVGGVLLRQLYHYLSSLANIKQTNTLRIRIFGTLFR